MVTVDTSQLNAVCKKIAATPGLGLTAWKVLKAEAGKVLEGAVRNTLRDSSARKVERSIKFKNRTLFDRSSKAPVIYFNLQGVGWFLDRPGDQYLGLAKGRKVGDRTFHPMTEFFKYSDDRWGRYQSLLSILKQKQIDPKDVLARAAQSWVQMAESAGIQLSGVPGYVRNAPAFKGNAKIHGYAQELPGTEIRFINQATVMLGTFNGERILESAITGRLQYFQQQLKRGVFEDVKNVVRSYPSLKAA